MRTASTIPRRSFSAVKKLRRAQNPMSERRAKPIFPSNRAASHTPQPTRSNHQSSFAKHISAVLSPAPPINAPPDPRARAPCPNQPAACRPNEQPVSLSGESAYPKRAKPSAFLCRRIITALQQPPARRPARARRTRRNRPRASVRPRARGPRRPADAEAPPH